MQSAPRTPLPTSLIRSKGKEVLSNSSRASSCTSPCNCMEPCSAFRFISSASFFWSSNCFSSSFTLRLCSFSLSEFFSVSCLRICSVMVVLSCCIFFCTSSSSSSSLFFSSCTFFKKSSSFFLASLSFSSLSLLVVCNNFNRFSKSDEMDLRIFSSIVVLKTFLSCSSFNSNSSSFFICHSFTFTLSSFSTSSLIASLGSNWCPQLGHLISFAIFPVLITGTN